MTTGNKSAIITTIGFMNETSLDIKTRVFSLSDGRYKNLSEMAQTMGISVSQAYRVRQGKRHINQKFVIGAIKAFPDCKLDDLFYFTTK